METFSKASALEMQLDCPHSLGKLIEWKLHCLGLLSLGT